MNTENLGPWLVEFAERLEVAFWTLMGLLAAIGRELVEFVLPHIGTVALFVLLYVSYRFFLAGLGSMAGSYQRTVGSFRRSQPRSSSWMVWIVTGGLGLVASAALLSADGSPYAANLFSFLVIGAGLALAFLGYRTYSQAASGGAPTTEDAHPLQSLLAPNVRGVAFVAGGLIVVLLALSSLNGRLEDASGAYGVAMQENLEKLDEQLGAIVTELEETLAPQPVDDDDVQQALVPVP